MSTLDTTLFGRPTRIDLSGPWAAYWILFMRLIVGGWFLHAGLDKIVVPFDGAGWMRFATEGGTPWVHAFLVWAANDPTLLAITNFMIPWGELLIGVGLIVGGLVRLASFFGVFLMLFFYLGGADWGHGFINGNLLGLVLFITLMVFGAGRVWGLDEYLEDTALVRNNPKLRYLLG